MHEVENGVTVLVLPPFSIQTVELNEEWGPWRSSVPCFVNGGGQIFLKDSSEVSRTVKI